MIEKLTPHQAAVLKLIRRQHGASIEDLTEASASSRTPLARWSASFGERPG